MMIDSKTQESANNSNETPFLMSNDYSMKIALEVVTILNKTGKIRIKGKGETCSSAVSVANIFTEIMLKENSKTEKIIVDSYIADNGQMISTIDIIITKIN